MLPPLIPSTRASQRRVEEPSCGTSAPGHVLPGTDLNMNSALGLATLHKPPQGAPALTVVLTVTKPVTLENGLLPRFELARRDTEASVAWDVPSLTTMEDGSPLPKGTVTLEPGKEYRMTMHSTPEPCDGETWAGIWSHIGDYRLELSIPRYSVHELTTPPK
jgi:hypothetical protein